MELRGAALLFVACAAGPVLGCKSEACPALERCVSSQAEADRLNAGSSCPIYAYCGADDASPVPADASVGDAPSDAPTAADADAGFDASAECDPSVAWPAMLAAPIAPGQRAANLDLNHDGRNMMSRAYAESVNCALALLPDAGVTANPTWPPQIWGTWGSQGEVVVSVDPTTSDVTSMLVQGDYTGTIGFGSRAGSSYGAHSYTLGVGQLTRDGAPWSIDWSSPTPFDEIMDGLIATYAPSIPPVQQCEAAGACTWGFSSPGVDAGADGGEDAYYFSIAPMNLAVGFDTVASGGRPSWIEVELPGGITDGGAPSD